MGFEPAGAMYRESRELEAEERRRQEEERQRRLNRVFHEAFSTIVENHRELHESVTDEEVEQKRAPLHEQPKESLHSLKVEKTTKSKLLFDLIKELLNNKNLEKFLPEEHKLNIITALMGPPLISIDREHQQAVHRIEWLWKEEKPLWAFYSRFEYLLQCLIVQGTCDYFLMEEPIRMELSMSPLTKKIFSHSHCQKAKPEYRAVKPLSPASLDVEASLITRTSKVFESAPLFRFLSAYPKTFESHPDEFYHHPRKALSKLSPSQKEWLSKVLKRWSERTERQFGPSQFDQESPLGSFRHQYFKEEDPCVIMSSLPIEEWMNLISTVEESSELLLKLSQEKAACEERLMANIREVEVCDKVYREKKSEVRKKFVDETIREALAIVAPILRTQEANKEPKKFKAKWEAIFGEKASPSTMATVLANAAIEPKKLLELVTDELKKYIDLKDAEKRKDMLPLIDFLMSRCDGQNIEDLYTAITGVKISEKGTSPQAIDAPYQEDQTSDPSSKVKLPWEIISLFLKYKLTDSAVEEDAREQMLGYCGKSQMQLTYSVFTALPFFSIDPTIKAQRLLEVNAVLHHIYQQSKHPTLLLSFIDVETKKKRDTGTFGGSSLHSGLNCVVLTESKRTKRTTHQLEDKQEIPMKMLLDESDSENTPRSVE